MVISGLILLGRKLGRRARWGGEQRLYGVKIWPCGVLGNGRTSLVR